MKYRVAAVSYVNTLPFLHGLQSPGLQEVCDVVLAHPARCAQMLEQGEVDIALCPVGALLALNKYHIITDYCIGCDGPVRTVSIYAHQPFDTLTHIILSDESRTSNLLAQVLNNHFWRLPLTFLQPEDKAIAPEKTTGYLHIGDRCFEKEAEFPSRTDLGQSWKEWTGLPFVFACWVSLQELPEATVAALNEGFAVGLAALDHMEFSHSYDPTVLRHYLKHNIQYTLDVPKKEAMARFLSAARNVGHTDTPVMTASQTNT